MKAVSVKKYNVIAIATVLTVFLSCKDIDRSNRLDPQNPDAEANQVTVVENFVHRYTTGDSVNRFVAYSQQALYELKQEYSDRMLILEYHLNLSTVNDVTKDTLFNPDSADIRARYVEYKGTTAQGFPHCFFNGKLIGIQGASSQATAHDRYKTILDTLTPKKSELYCDAEKTFDGDTLRIKAKIAKFGDDKITNLQVEFIVIEDMGHLRYYTVRAILPFEEISEIQPGEIYEFENTKSFRVPSSMNKQKTDVIIIIKDKASKKILQSCKVF